MKIKLPLILITLLVFLLVPLPVKAAAFKLTAIGSLDVSQQVYSHMWYTGNQPTFSGTGTSGSTVNITLDGSSYTTTVNTSERWSWQPAAALASSDHSLTFSSGVESVSLTLTTGSNVPSSTASGQVSTSSALPQTGFFTPTLVLLAIGLGMIIFPLWKKFRFQKSNP